MKTLISGLGLALLLTLATACGGADDPPMLEDIPGYATAHDRAELYCTLGGVVPGMRGLHDPAYLQCVEDETRSRLVKQGHADAETAESRLR